MSDNVTDLQLRLGQMESRLKNLEEKVETFLVELRDDMKEIKASTSLISTIVVDQKYHKEEVNKLTQRVIELETFQKTVDAYHNKIEGAKQFAWILWGLLTSGVVTALLKIFG